MSAFKIVKRILFFKCHDWEHVGWLFGNMIKQFLAGDLRESKESWFWICIHCTYDSKKIK
jgi:hypothetical protein